jgi:hypothetical protein
VKGFDSVAAVFARSFKIRQPRRFWGEFLEDGIS